MPFARFMELALYDPAVGYYRRPGRGSVSRPGRISSPPAPQGTVFGELIAAACAALLGQRDPRDYAWVEIGAESAAADPRRRFPSLRLGAHDYLGEALTLEGKCVVFSNELFDAQPCRRFAFRRSGWRELGVRLREGTLGEVDLPIEASPPQLPKSAPEGAIIDAPLAAAALLEKIAAQPWTGLFLACDYGKSWADLTEETPEGTVRAYHQHRQSNDLLARPGEQDLTCHVCWDWLVDALRRQGFANPQVESQEAFFVHHASAYIAETTQAEAARFSQKKMSLLQLLHPANMGQKFQVLHGSSLRGQSLYNPARIWPGVASGAISSLLGRLWRRGTAEREGAPPRFAGLSGPWRGPKKCPCLPGSAVSTLDPYIHRNHV